METPFGYETIQFHIQRAVSESLLWARLHTRLCWDTAVTKTLLFLEDSQSSRRDKARMGDRQTEESAPSPMIPHWRPQERAWSET